MAAARGDAASFPTPDASRMAVVVRIPRRYEQRACV
jgi:hypothetical protein